MPFPIRFKKYWTEVYVMSDKIVGFEPDRNDSRITYLNVVCDGKEMDIQLFEPIETVRKKIFDAMKA